MLITSLLHHRAEVVANLQSCMGNAYLEMGQMNQATSHFQKDLEICKQQKDKPGKARALGNMGRAQARQGEYGKAIDRYEVIYAEFLSKSADCQQRSVSHHADAVRISMSVQ